MPTAVTPDLTSLLEKHFGYRTFRPLQQDVIETVIAKNNALVVMPTGSGKSLCFQLPALCMDGTTLVISPLIALMKDQVDGLQADGIRAAFLNSSQTGEEQMKVKNAVKNGDVRLLYIAPERLAASGFQAFLSSIQISMIAIDEAHCISEWGHEFRPDYRNLKTLRETFPQVPCIALTATATPKVRDDIRQQLNLGDAKLFLSSFNRENLTYHVYPKAQAFERLLLALRTPSRLPAIVYCFSRKDTESLAVDLRAEGFSALPYHAGLDPGVRRQTQEKFMRDEVSVITATVAFGMGIDKPDVRTVVHMDLPKNVEGYYQETGRAGRDGLQSDCILFYSFGDRFKQEFFINQMEDPIQKQHAQEKLDLMLQYGELLSCRRTYLLEYFGEKVTSDSCNGCDRCLSTGELFDATEIAGKVLSAVVRTGERFGTAHICGVLRGKTIGRIRELKHDTLPVFGIVKEFDDRQLREIVGMLIGQRLLAKATGQYPTLSVTEIGKDFLLQKKRLQLRKPESTVRVAERAKDLNELPFDTTLFEELRVVRRGLADKHNVAAFIIFGDRSLREMATYFPQSTEAFGHIYGVSDRKLEQYGEYFLAVIRQYAAEHNLQEHELTSTKGAKKRRRERKIRSGNSTYDVTRTLLEQKLPLSEIAKTRDLREGTIVQHIEALMDAGVSLDMEHLRPPPEIYAEIAQAFHAKGGEALSPIFDMFEGKYTFDQLRLVRALLKKSGGDIPF